MIDLFENIKERFYMPNFKHPTQLAYDVARIIISFVFGVSGYIISQFLYFLDKPLLGVSFVGEVLVGVLSFALFYYLIPFVLKAVAEGIQSLLKQSIRESLQLINFPKGKNKKKPQLKEYKSRPVILDTSSIIDGRICSVIQEGFLEAQIIVPQFVLDELHLIADSKSKLKRDRGRRGLSILDEIKQLKKQDLKIYPSTEVKDVDKALVTFAKKIKGRIATCDYNLNKVAKVAGVMVLNINSLSNSLKVNLLPGDILDIKVVKKGQEKGQGIGYLDDGTLVVIADAEAFINKKVESEVTKVLQTEAGKMVFAYITTSDVNQNIPNSRARNSGEKTEGRSIKY